MFRVLGGVPGFLGAPGCSGMFRCSSVPGSTKADRVLCQLVMFLTVFFHWMYKMKYSCYQESSVIHGWFVYWVFG